MLASIGFVHFTDLHVGTRALRAHWPTIENELFRDLEYVHGLAGPWDMVLFTGDLAFSGQREQFEKVQEFLGSVWEKFHELGSDPKFVAIPGNHDLTWPSPQFARTLVSKWDDEKLQDDFWGDDRKGYRSKVRETFAEFGHWWNRLSAASRDGNSALVPTLPFTHEGYLPGDFAATLEKDGIKLGVLGLNSTFLQLSRRVQEGELAVAAEQIQEACGGDLPRWAKTNDECLILTHQPDWWLRDSSKAALHEDAIHPADPILHLFGHMHEAEQSSESRNGGPQRHRLQGASLFGIEYWRTKQEQRVHGYSACRLEFEEDATRLRIWPRLMTRLKGGGWEFGPDRDYRLLRGKEEIKPILKPRERPLHVASHRPVDFVAEITHEIGVYVWGAADFEAGLATTEDGDDDFAIEHNEPIDVAALRSGHVKNIQPQFTHLAREFDGWLHGAGSDADTERLRVFWLVGEDVPHRSKARLACISRAGDARLVADASRDLARAGTTLEWCYEHRRASTTTLISVELDEAEPNTIANVVRNRVSQARMQGHPGKGPDPQLVVAGSVAQGQQAYRELHALVEFTAIDTNGQAVRLDKVPVPSRRERVFNRGLPMTAPELFGREDELETLREAWNSPQTKLLSIVAFGGTGKSALVNTWLQEMSTHDYMRAHRVLAWSFYSQGTKENLVSADEFIGRSLDWLGSRLFSLNPWARGMELAARIKEQGKFLLVLDGVEPLQHPPDAPEVGGRLTDDSIWALLQSLAEPDWQGLCVITTRVDLSDLRPFECGGSQSRGTVEKLELGNLKERDGMRLLAHLIGRQADSGELRDAVHEIKGHALAITLLGHYLRDVKAGDLAGRFDLEQLTKAERDGGHARRVMATYARWFQDNRHLAELALLRLIGLFDRPAEPMAMEALLADRALGPLVHALDEVGGPAWNHALDALRRAALLNEAFPDDIGVLDAHPLVREHFREDLRSGSPEMWLAGNRRLFHHYAESAPRVPSDAKSMQPLYAAATHGCSAELFQQVFDEVLLPRIWRDRRTNYSTRHLGLTGADLVALSNYFEARRWTDLKRIELTPEAAVLIRTNAGVRLRQLGRLRDARDCFGAVVAEIDRDAAGEAQLENASYAAAQDCELLVIAGRLVSEDEGGESALASGERAVEYADLGSDAYFQMHARSSLAEVYFMLSDLDRAGTLFEQAMEIERRRASRPPFLYSQGLYRYGYYLIERGEAASILREATQDSDWGSNGTDSSLLSKAIRLLILGAARRAKIELGDRSPELLAETGKILNEAHDQFQTAGYRDYLVRGVLERAHFFRVRGAPDDYGKARADLHKAALEAERGQMSLLLAEVHLGRAACGLDYWPRMSNPQRSDARAQISEALAEARTLVASLRYHRRDAMLQDLQERAIAAGVNP